MDFASLNIDSQSVVFVRPGKIGDLICSMPLIYEFRRRFPKTKITLAVGQENAPILPFLSGYDHAITLPGNSFNLSRKKFRKMRRKYRRENLFDIAISCFPYHSRKFNRLIPAFNAKTCIAVTKYKYFTSLRLPHIQIHPFKPEGEPNSHISTSVLNVVFSEFHEVPEHLYPKLHLPKNQKTSNTPELNKFLEKNETPLILISASNNREYSFPGIALYSDLLNTLHDERKFRALISCKTEDRIVAHAIQHRLNAPSCLVNSTDMGEYLKLLSLADLVFVGDGGIMHMAAALDKKQVVLFGRTRVVEWQPLSKKAVCLAHPTHVSKIDKQEILRALIKQL